MFLRQKCNLIFFHKTPRYGCLWTCLDPSNNFWGDLDPGAKFWVQGAFGPKIKNLSIPNNMGVYGLAWTPAISFEVIWTPGPNFGSKGPLAPNSKICKFRTKPHNVGVYGLAWTPAIIFWGLGPLGPNFGSKGLLDPNSKICTYPTM